MTIDNSNIKITFPKDFVLAIEARDHRFLADYPVESGGSNLAPSPWELFLSSLTACQAVNLLKYCRAHDIPYEDVEVELQPMMEDIKHGKEGEFRLAVTVPETFPKEHIEPMVASFMACPVGNQLTENKPWLSTYVNGKLIQEKRSE